LFLAAAMPSPVCSPKQVLVVHNNNNNNMSHGLLENS
jgi:hypothetical protein